MTEEMNESSTRRALGRRRKARYPRGWTIRSDDDILADILRTTAQSGRVGEGMTRLKQRSNLNDSAFKKHLGILMDLGLISSEMSEESGNFRRTFRLTEMGYRYLGVYEKIESLMVSSVTAERAVQEDLVRVW